MVFLSAVFKINFRSKYLINMKSFLFSIILLTIVQFSSLGQTTVTARIQNYPQKQVFVYRCYGDTLIFVDSTKTDDKGILKFSFPINNSSAGIYRFNLPRNQWFYILTPKNSNRKTEEIKINTVFQIDLFNNIASDSLIVVESEQNRMFYRFQSYQQKIAIANAFLKGMMRQYPLLDPLHPVLVKEWESRFSNAKELYQEISKNPLKLDTVVHLIASAYYQPINPDWKIPDNIRDSIIAAHYFDYFNPANDFYLNTNILPEKIYNYFDLFSALIRIKRESHTDYELKLTAASHEFLKHTQMNAAVHQFCLQFIMKKLDKEKMYDALYSVYDKWVYTGNVGDCEQTNPSLNQWREKISVLRNIQIGKTAPDFEIAIEKLNMHKIPADYLLLVFWATWCPHCIGEVPKIKNIVNDFQSKHKGQTLVPIFISLDNSEIQWKDFVKKNDLQNYIHLCDLKGWKGEIVKRFNVFATPSMFLLDNEKKIIAKPEDISKLNNILKSK